MILQIFSIYDTKAESFNPPVYLTSPGLAIRSFSDSVQNPESQFAQHPEDYTLFQIGSWDDQTSKFELLSTPKSLHVAIEFVSPTHPLNNQFLKTEE